MVVEEIVEASLRIKQAVPLLKDLKIQASLQAQQQADSLRYLNELNTVHLFSSP